MTTYEIWQMRMGLMQERTKLVAMKVTMNAANALAQEDGQKLVDDAIKKVDAMIDQLPK